VRANVTLTISGGVNGPLLRWTSTRSIKETFVPPTDHRYPHMG
jgi:1-pyrroline-5-carboxylate dehydrogenase